MVENVHWSACKVAVILVRFQWNLYFLDRVSENLRMLNFMKIRHWEPNYLCGRTDMTKLLVAFRNFANAPKNSVPMSLCPPRMIHGLTWTWTRNPVWRNRRETKTAALPTAPSLIFGFKWVPWLRAFPSQFEGLIRMTLSVRMQILFLVDLRDDIYIYISSSVRHVFALSCKLHI